MGEWNVDRGRYGQFVLCGIKMENIVTICVVVTRVHFDLCVLCLVINGGCCGSVFLLV